VQDKKESVIAGLINSSLFLAYISDNFCRVITLEDVLEKLLQGDIYDEGDKTERQAKQVVATKLGQKWRQFLNKRKEQREQKKQNPSFDLEDGSSGGGVGKKTPLLEDDIGSHLCWGSSHASGASLGGWFT
jgi:hypothetical protein